MVLGYAIRRLLWIPPILLGVTLAAFFVLSYVPDPADDPRLNGVLSIEQIAELRRSRFLDLPRFFNAHPVDLGARVDEATAHIVRGDADEPAARSTLAHLGGAALAYLIPRLDAYNPQERGRIANALAPLAERIGLLAGADVESGAETGPHSLAFWNRFWADRSIDFRPAAARRAVRRLSEHATSMREANLVELDTYALAEIMSALAESAKKREVEPMRRLIDVADHITGRADAPPQGASLAEVRASAERLLDWWLVHRADYAVYDGASRIMAMLLDSQYAKWAERFLATDFSGQGKGARTFDQLGERALRSFLLAGGAVLLAYAAALLSGVIGVVRSRDVDPVLAAATLVLYAVPTACLAVALAGRPGNSLGVLLPVATLACGLLATPAAHTRAALFEHMRRDCIQSARALGTGSLRLVCRHALRGALIPIAALLSVEMPAAVGGAFVVEKAFGIQGLGEETVRAVHTHNVLWLMALALGAALAGALGSIAYEVALSAIDPRLASMTLRRRRTVE